MAEKIKFFCNNSNIPGSIVRGVFAARSSRVNYKIPFKPVASVVKMLNKIEKKNTHTYTYTQFYLISRARCQSSAGFDLTRHSGAIKFPCTRNGEKLKCTTDYKFLESSERRKKIPGFAFAAREAESKTPGAVSNDFHSRNVD